MDTNAAETIALIEVDLDEVIGENVHQLMWRGHISQTAFAPLLNLTQSGLSHKLRGRRPWTAAEINAAALHFGVSRDSLFSRATPGAPVNDDPSD